MSLSSVDDTLYAIYTFERGKKESRIRNWRRHAVITDRHLALAEAQSLYDTRRFEKIEVKQRVFDLKKSRFVDTTLKIHERISQTPKRIMALALCCALWAIGGALLTGVVIAVLSGS